MTNIKELTEAVLHKYTEATETLYHFMKDTEEFSVKSAADHHAVCEKLQRLDSDSKAVTLRVTDSAVPAMKITGRELDILTKVMTTRLSAIQRYPNLLLSMSLIYLVSIFEGLLHDLFSAAFLARPEALKSRKKQLSYEKILTLQSSGTIVEYLAQREMHELGYQSVEEQIDYYREKFGIDLLESGVSADDLVEIHAARNVLVHNNGIINPPYLEKVSTQKYKAGDALQITPMYWESVFEKLRTVAHFSAKAVVGKFGRTT
jgi:hypothetical protein